MTNIQIITKLLDTMGSNNSDVFLRKRNHVPFNPREVQCQH